MGYVRQNNKRAGESGAKFLSGLNCGMLAPRQISFGVNVGGDYGRLRNFTRR